MVLHKRGFRLLAGLVVLHQLSISVIVVTIGVIIGGLPAVDRFWKIAFCVVAAVTSCLAWAVNYVYQRWANYQPQADVQRVALRKIFSLGLDQIQDANAAYVKDVIDRGEAAFGGLVHELFFKMLPVAVQCAISCALIFYFASWWLAAAALACVLASVCLSVAANNRFIEACGEHVENARVVTCRFSELLEKTGTVKRNNEERSVLREHEESLERLCAEGVALGVRQANAAFFYKLPLHAGLVGVVLLSVGLCGKGLISVPESVWSVWLSYNLLRQFESVMEMLRSFVGKSADVFAYGNLLKVRPKARRRAKRPESVFDGDIVFDNVHYGRILNGFSHTFERGKVNVIVGPSGAGKTTLLRLLDRSLVPQSGRILIGGVDIEDIDPRQLYHEMAVVTQRPEILSGTVRRIISFGANGSLVHMKDEGFRLVMDRSGVSSFSDRLGEQPLEAIIKDGGSNLSGGELQMLAFAQAICRQSRILLLDEAFSAVDPGRSHALFEEVVGMARSGRTCVAIAHSATMMQRSDRVVMVVDGRAQCRGTHEQLMSGVRKGSSPYVHLFQGKLSLELSSAKSAELSELGSRA